MHLPTTVTFDQQRAALAALGISEDDAKHIYRLDMGPHEIKVSFYLTRNGSRFVIPETDEIAQSEAVITITSR